MARFKDPTHKRTRRIPRRLFIVLAVLVGIVVAAAIGVRVIYNQNLEPVSSSQQTKVVTIENGSSVKEIADLLARAGVIRGAWVFEWYVHSEQLTNKLQAGTYAFAPSQPLRDIASTLTKGKVETALVTIVPGSRIDQVRARLINDGYTPAAVDAALTPDQYRDLPVMGYVPAETKTLEGLLYPESFQRNNTDDPRPIIRQSLQLMGQAITPEMQASFAANGLTVYQALIIASMVETEVPNQDERDQAAQVFLSRLKIGMSLGSDVTANYGAILDGKTPSVNYDSPYNTRKYKGLPPGPVAISSEGSIKAVANPSATNWLYFVSGDDGITRFQETYEQHQKDTQTYCTKLCGV